jgi:hypothetical protein
MSGDRAQYVKRIKQTVNPGELEPTKDTSKTTEEREGEYIIYFL